MEFFKYNNKFLNLLEKYFQHVDTPVNNNSHKNFKTKLYDEDKGICGILVDKNEIVAVSSAIIIEENGSIACKYPHRLHVRNDYSYISNIFIDQFWDPLLFDWVKDKNISNMYATVNEGNEKALFWAALRHQRRKKHLQYVNDFGKIILNQPWYVYPYKMLDMHVFQYILYNNSFPFHFRDKMIINTNIKEYLNNNFKFVEKLGWQI